MHALSLAQYVWRPWDVLMRLTIEGDRQRLVSPVHLPLVLLLYPQTPPRVTVTHLLGENTYERIRTVTTYSERIRTLFPWTARPGAQKNFDTEHPLRNRGALTPRAV
jgi:hypothetical protein